MSQPTQKQIYARRRSLAILAAAVLSVLVWLGSAGIGSLLSGSGSDVSGPAQNDVAAAPQNLEPAACAAGSVTVEAFVGDESGPKSSFAESEDPLVWHRLTSQNSVDCYFNAGARVTFFTITSGQETIWSSRQCDRSGDADAQVLLKPNEPVESPKGAWLKVRSSEAGCGEGERSVITGGASYFLKAEVNGEISQNPQQFLLN